MSAVAQGAGTSPVRAAGAGDAGAVRALLGSVPMSGSIRIGLGPGPEGEAIPVLAGERHSTLLAADPDGGPPLGMGSRTVRMLYWRGEPVPIGYLGQLRVAPGRCGIRRLRAGFQRLRRERRPGEVPFDLTTIVADNIPARRLLERGLPGLPAYRPLTDVQTLILATDRGRTVPGPGARRATQADLPAVLAFLRAALRRRPFAPAWDSPGLWSGGARGLGLQDLWLAEDGGRVLATAALWDQRAYREVVVHGYAPWLRHLRPVVNVGLGLLGQPTLPPPGSVLPLASLAAFVVEDDAPGPALALVEAMRGEARRRGLGQLVLSLAADHSLIAPLGRRFRPRLYRSVLYAVSWPDEPPPAGLLGGDRPHVEAALL